MSFLYKMSPCGSAACAAEPQSRMSLHTVPVKVRTSYNIPCHKTGLLHLSLYFTWYAILLRAIHTPVHPGAWNYGTDLFISARLLVGELLKTLNFVGWPGKVVKPHY